mgnify:CR=1 FL=1
MRLTSSSLVWENVVDHAELLVQVGRLDARRQVPLRVVNVDVPGDEESLRHVDRLKCDEKWDRDEVHERYKPYTRIEAPHDSDVVLRIVLEWEKIVVLDTVEVRLTCQDDGANDRKTALSWITGSETFYHSQDVEHFVWEQGILFTQYGKQLVKDLAEIVEYKEYDYEWCILESWSVFV